MATEVTTCIHITTECARTNHCAEQNWGIFSSITPERSPSIVFLSVWHRRLKCYAVTDSRTLCCRLLLGSQAFSFWSRVAHSYLIHSRSIPWVFIIHTKQHATQCLWNLFKIYFYQKCLRNVLVFSRYAHTQLYLQTASSLFFTIYEDAKNLILAICSKKPKHYKQIFNKLWPPNHFEF